LNAYVVNNYACYLKNKTSVKSLFSKEIAFKVDKKSYYAKSGIS